MQFFLAALWTIVPVIAFDAIGQKLPERGYIQTEELDTEDIEVATFYYDWNVVEDPDVWRWNVEEYPHPQLSPRFCQRMEPSNVCDPDQILSKNQADLLDASIRQFFNETPCICEKCSPEKSGIQIGIALLKSMYMPYNERPAKVIQSFTTNLRSKWRLGDCNDDILVVLAIDHRRSYTDVGGATSRFLPQDEAHRIFLENKAHFSEKRYFEGLQAMLENYNSIASRIPKEEQKQEDLEVGKISGIVIGILIILSLLALAIIWIYRRYKKKQYNDNGQDVESSTWRKKIRLSPPLFSGKDTYAPCKTVDDDICNNKDDQARTEFATKESMAASNEEVHVETSEVQKAVPSTSGSSSGLHQTDL